MKRLLLIVGAALLIGAGIWKFAISPGWEQRLSSDWEWNYENLGSVVQEVEDESIFDTPVENDEAVASSISQTVAQDNVTDESVAVNIDYTEVDPLTGEPVYSYEDFITVDPQTGKHTREELSDYYYVFPRNVEKQGYNIFDSYYGLMDFEFVGEEMIGDLLTYHFVFEADVLDETEVYVADELIEEGTAVVCYDVHVDYWIEPVTGENVKLNEVCPREYYVNSETRENLSAYGRWAVYSSGDSVQRRVNEVGSQLNTYRWMTQYVPILLAVGGVLLLVLSVFLPQPNPDEKTQTAA